MEDEEKFSNDPEEQMRIENELLKLKLQAELGASFGDTQDLPPEVEHEFLKQVLAFHEHQQHAPMIKLQTYINSPDLPGARELTIQELNEAWEELEELLNNKHLQVVFGRNIPLAVRYDFVLKELFPLEIIQPGEGHNWVFDYEEFHPDHIAGLERLTAAFMNAFFENSLTDRSDIVAAHLISAEGKTISRSLLSEKINSFHDLFAGLKEQHYETTETLADIPEDSAIQATGAAEGSMQYTIQTDDHQEQVISGPFKLYFRQAHGKWEISSFSLPGFTMD